MRIASPHALFLRLLGALVLPAVVGALYAQATACAPPCTVTERVWDQGDRWNEGDRLVWQSSASDYLPFTGATTYHFKHNLGARPYDYSIDLAFSERPEVPGNGGHAKSAGNLALVLRSDENEIVVKSDTCADYYIRIVVYARPTTATDGGVDAPADAPADTASDTATDTAIETSTESGTDASADVSPDGATD
jgi:hypothetical protein